MVLVCTFATVRIMMPHSSHTFLNSAVMHLAPSSATLHWLTIFLLRQQLCSLERLQSFVDVFTFYVCVPCTSHTMQRSSRSAGRAITKNQPLYDPRVST